MQRLMNGPLKSVVANGARKQVAKKARPQHYPAPYAIIDLWQKHDGNALAAPEVVDRIISLADRPQPGACLLACRSA